MKATKNFNRGALLAVTLALLASCTSLAQNTPVETIPFKMDGSHIQVEASVNGSEKVSFTFDTGGGTALIDSDRAAEIGMKETSQSTGGGAAGSMTFSVSSGNTVQMGDLEFTNNNFVMTSLAHMRRMGGTTEGVLGYQQISEYVVKIDYEKEELVFYDKDTYAYKGSGVEIPIGLEMRIPSIDGKIELADGTEIEGRFLIDTGAGLYGSMNTPAVNKYNAKSTLDKSFSIGAGGATGRFTMVVGRIKSLSFGGNTFEGLPFTFNDAKAGALADPNYIGLVGNRVMRRFNIILDYANSRMILEPNSFYDDPFRVNASGIVTMVNSKGQLTAAQILDDSPAEKIGMKNGDLLLSVNGIKGISKNRPKIRNLMEEEGKELEVTWERNGETMNGKITLINSI